MEELTPSQRTALLALAAGENKHTVAAKAGVTVRTIERWLQKDNFKFLYNNACRESYFAGVAQLCDGAQAAAIQLRGIIADPDTLSTIKVRAIDILFKHAGRVGNGEIAIIQALKTLLTEGVIPGELAKQLLSKTTKITNEMQNIFTEGNEDREFDKNQAIALIQHAILGTEI